MLSCTRPSAQPQTYLLLRGAVSVSSSFAIHPRKHHRGVETCELEGRTGCKMYTERRLPLRQLGLDPAGTPGGTMWNTIQGFPLKVRKQRYCLRVVPGGFLPCPDSSDLSHVQLNSCPGQGLPSGREEKISCHVYCRSLTVACGVARVMWWSRCGTHSGPFHHDLNLPRD